MRKVAEAVHQSEEDGYEDVKVRRVSPSFTLELPHHHMPLSVSHHIAPSPLAFSQSLRPLTDVVLWQRRMKELEERLRAEMDARLAELEVTAPGVIASGRGWRPRIGSSAAC